MEPASSAAAPASRPLAAPPRPAGASSAEPARTLIDIHNLDFFYGAKQALFDINLHIPDKRVTAFIGPSGCGKSTA